MKRLSRLFVAALAFAAVSLFAVTAWCLPRFSVRDGVPCITCHVNPSGGGMRNGFGRVYAATRLPMAIPGSGPMGTPIQTGFGDTLNFGADARTASIYQKPPTGAQLLTFFQMQADLYVSAQLFDGLTLLYDQGAWGSFEAMAIYRKQVTDWASFYVKGGRFMPTYGLRLENHNLWVRQDIGFGPRDKDQGVEVGAQIGPFLLQGAVLNGTPQERQLDENKQKAIVARIEWLQRFGPLKLMLGGSLYRNETGLTSTTDGVTVDSRSTQRKYGGFAGASLGRFTYLTEMDYVKLDPYPGNSQDTYSRTLQSYNELDVLIIRGLELNFNFEVRDPNLDLKSGRERRWAVGFEVYPMPYLELKGLYRHIVGTGPAVAADVGLSEYIAMAHIFF